MKLFTHKKLSWIYGLLLVWGLTVFLAIQFLVLAPWIIVSAFFFTILLPGFCLKRIFRIELSADLLGQVILALVFGFVFVFLLSFVAILTGLNINQLQLVYLISLPCLLLVAMILDLGLRGENGDFTFDFRNILVRDNLIYVLPAILVILVLAAVGSTGGNFNGDPRYHLAIIRKAIEGQSLTPANLNYVKGQFSIAYVFPVWHVFLALFSKITQANIFVVWNQLALPLTLLVLMIWYWFLNKIFRNRYLVVLSFIFLIAFYFKDGGYLFTRLLVPDTLCGLLFLPLSVGLSLKYIFETKNHFRLLLLISFLVILMAAIHFTQYFYFLFLMVVFGLIFTLVCYRDPNFKPAIKRLGAVLGINLLILGVFLLLLEAKNKIFSTTLQAYFSKENNATPIIFGQFDLFTQVGFILLPLTLIFVKKYRALILAMSALVTIILIYSPAMSFLQSWLSQFLTRIFVERLYDNLNWVFLVWGLITAVVLILIDYFMFENKTRTRLVTIGATILALLVVFSEIKWQFFTLANQNLFLTVSAYLAQNYFYFALIVTFVAVFLIFNKKYASKISPITDFEKPRNQLVFLLLGFIITFPFVAPIFHQGLPILSSEILSQQFVLPVEDLSGKIAPPVELGGQETIDFIREKIPPKSVFYSDKGYYSIAMLTDEYLPTYNQRSPRTYDLVFKGRNVSHENRVRCFKQGKIDYFILASTNLVIQQLFTKYPQYFEMVYQGQATIYKINYIQAEEDFSLQGTDGLSCGPR